MDQETLVVVQFINPPVTWVTDFVDSQVELKSVNVGTEFKGFSLCVYRETGEEEEVVDATAEGGKRTRKKRLIEMFSPPGMWAYYGRGPVPPELKAKITAQRAGIHLLEKK